MKALPLAAALAWTLALIVDRGSLGSTGALLTGVGLLLMSTVAVVGMIITGSRWSHRLAAFGVMCGLVVGVVRPIDLFWVLALVLSALAGAVLYLPAVTGRIRRLPAAAGPPTTAVVLPIALISFPYAMGFVIGTSQTWAVMTVGLSAPVFAFGYARVIPGGLLGVRLVWPLIALAAAPFLSLSAATLSAIAALGVAALAWRPEVKASFHPPREAGTSYPIPPELAPPDILDAAGLDDRGRRK